MLLLQEFDIKILDRSGAHNLVADHLSRIENGGDNIPIKDDFPDEVLLALTAVKGMFPEPWFADIVNYLVVSAIPPSFSKYERTKLKSEAKYYIWEDPILWRIGSDQVIRRCVPDIEIPHVLEFCHSSPFGGHYGTQRTGRKVLDCGLYWPTWEGPYIVTKVFPYGAVEIKEECSARTFKVNGHRLRIFNENPYMLNKTMDGMNLTSPSYLPP